VHLVPDECDRVVLFHAAKRMRSRRVMGGCSARSRLGWRWFAVRQHGGPGSAMFASCV
jgi:hypothetical protein